MTVLAFLADNSQTLKVAGAATDLAASSRALIKKQDAKIVDGINGFVFSIPQTESLNFQAQITDHWTETNVAIQDHIAIEPTKITLTAIVSEVVWSKDKAAAAAEQAIQRAMEVPALRPAVDQNTTQYLAAYDESRRQYDSALKSYTTLNDLYKNNQVANTKQGEAYGTLSQYFLTRTLCTVNTPWKFFTNMAIESLSFNQDETTKDYSTITVTFKQINSISVIATQVALQPIPESQRSEIKDQGAVQNQSVADGIYENSVNSVQKAVGK
jgi:hypothetical protein